MPEKKEIIPAITLAEPEPVVVQKEKTPEVKKEEIQVV